MVGGMGLRGGEGERRTGGGEGMEGEGGKGGVGGVGYHNPITETNKIYHTIIHQ